jgi:RNA polymerase sigma-70 factor (ECF subfamily)
VKGFDATVHKSGRVVVRSEAPGIPGPESATAAASLDALYREHGATVARWVLRLGGPSCDGEDAVQEVFAIVAERLSAFRGDAKVATWLYGITENVVREQRRRARVRRWFSGGDDQSGADVPATARLPVELLEQRQASQLVYRALDKMREPYRTALILFELEGISGEQIAELKKAKVSTVWVWLHRARAQFLEQITRISERP